MSDKSKIESLKDLKVALLCYHKNAFQLYKPHWIKQYRDSIQDQTFQEFDVFEINYGGGKERIFEHSYFESIEYPTFIHALNYLLDKVFSSGYEYAMNTNLDDWYRQDALEKLLIDIKNGYDLVSSNFCLVKDDVIFKYHRFDHLNIFSELTRGHNIISHPCLIYSKAFWSKNRYDPLEIPTEDLQLWQRALKSGMKLYINEENLLFHRVHDKSVCTSQNR